MLTAYFCCELRNPKWEQKFHALSSKCVVVMLTVGFFLALFILIVVELLYSLAYVASEVYTHYASWNETQCAREIYITSFTILTFSTVVVFILLTVLGVFVALLFIKWVTDSENPGHLRGLILAIHPRSTCVEKQTAVESSIVESKL